jgi:hypothetical protein
MAFMGARLAHALLQGKLEAGGMVLRRLFHNRMDFSTAFPELSTGDRVLPPAASQRAGMWELE